MLDRSHFGFENDNNLKGTIEGEIPILKVGLIKQSDFINFKLSGKFSVLNDQGIPILKGVTAQVKWLLKIENRQKAKYEYSILLNKYFDKRLAEEQEYQLIEKGIGVKIKSMGIKFYLKNNIVSDNTEYWLVVDKLASEQEANEFAKEMFANFSYSIIKEKLNEPHALLELYDHELEKLSQAENCIRVVPESPESVTYIYGLKVNSPILNNSKDYAAICGPIEFRCLDNGKIAAICEMTIEDYVKNVVAFQMHSDLPTQMIKAHAITVRSKMISNLGIKHFDDPFDLCSENDCQSFLPVFQIPKIISDSVENTSGLVMIHEKQILDSNYSAICGGHTESVKYISSETICETYPPIFDSIDKEIFKEYNDLSQSDNIKKWIDEKPRTCCNLDHQTHNYMPNSFVNNFRWRLTYDREDLEKIISEKSGTDIGTLYEIIPVSRSVSGRLQEIEILASNTNLVIVNELEMCEILSIDKLPSSCFLIETQLDENGFPMSFTFRGAGYGHGVGMCLTGGITMAQNDYDYTEILQHYFRNMQLKKIYEV